MQGYAINAAGVLSLAGKPVRQVPSPYGRGDLVPNNLRWLVMHYTAGFSGLGSARLFQENSAQVSAHFVVERDGAIIQCRPTTKVANHAGRSRYEGDTALNDNSIGVEIANRGFVMEPTPGFVEARHRLEPGISRFWEPYPERQIQAVIALNRAILARHTSIKAIIGHDECSLSGKTDPGPLFPMQRVQDAGALETQWRVNSPAGLNLRQTPDLSHPPRVLMANRDVVSVVSKDGLWWQVRHDRTDLLGWAHSSFLVRSAS